MRFLSVCSGIEAASVAWPMWQSVGFSEIEPFPCAVLAHHYPDVPNYGDMTALPGRIRSGEIEAPDLLCGGTPCQAFSVAGLRQSLSDERGNLSLVFCRIADAIDDVRRTHGRRPGIVFYENVPGILSTRDNAFGCLLAGLAGEDEPIAPGGRWTNAGVVAGPRRTVAWRVIDAQGFVPQRRRRVFVVASGDVDWVDPVAVLFEPEAEAVECLGDRLRSGPLFPVSQGGIGDPEKGRQAREVAPTIPSRSTAGGGLGTDFACDGGLIQADVPTLDASFGRLLGCNGQDVNHGHGHLIPTVSLCLNGGGADTAGCGVGDADSYHRRRLRCLFAIRSCRLPIQGVGNQQHEPFIRITDPGQG